MVGDGFEQGEAGVRRFSEAYGVLEELRVIEPRDNACSEARISNHIRRRREPHPFCLDATTRWKTSRMRCRRRGGSHRCGDGCRCCDPPTLRFERDPEEALQNHPGNQSVISSGLNALLLYPDRRSGSET